MGHVVYSNRQKKKKKKRPKAKKRRNAPNYHRHRHSAMFSFLGWRSSPYSVPQPAAVSVDSVPDLLRGRQQQQEQQQRQPIPTSTTPPSATTTSSSTFPNRNLKLLFGGVTSAAFSVLITRRACRSRILASTPPFYTSSVYHRQDISGPNEALEALSLATINVLSFAMALSGGILYALDINSLEDMRKIARRSLMGGSPGPEDEQIEKEVEGWVLAFMGKNAEADFQSEMKRARSAREGEEISGEGS